jgi:hypothetical protein
MVSEVVRGRATGRVAGSVAGRRAGLAAGRRDRLRRRRTAVYVGLAILLVLVVEAASGWVLWVAAHRRAALATAFLDALPADRLDGPWGRWLLDVPSMTDVHVWFGYLLLGLIGVKLWAVWWLLRTWFPRRFGRRRLLFEKVAAWSLPVVYGVILVTGVALDQRLGLVWGRELVRDVHLWSSELAAPVTAWHLARFMPTVWRVARHDLRGPRGPRRQSPRAA